MVFDIDLDLDFPESPYILPTAAPTSSPDSPIPAPDRWLQPVTPISAPRPSEPLAWLWQCHQCHRTWRLAATRRCLNDGHLFCAGTTVIQKRDQPVRVKRHAACASEFDYGGWKRMGDWRRDVYGLDKENVDCGVAEKDCWGKCDYPSQCRWGNMFGVEKGREVASVGIKDDASEEGPLLGGNGKEPGGDPVEKTIANEKQTSKFLELMDEVDVVPAAAPLLVTEHSRKRSDNFTEKASGIIAKYCGTSYPKERQKGAGSKSEERRGARSIKVC